MAQTARKPASAAARQHFTQLSGVKESENMTVALGPALFDVPRMPYRVYISLANRMKSMGSPESHRGPVKMRYIGYPLNVSSASPALKTSAMLSTKISDPKVSGNARPNRS